MKRKKQHLVHKPRPGQQLTLEIVKNMLTLSTAGLGLVTALAWNNVISEFVNAYIKPYLPQGSGFISLLIYAVLITIIAVTVTYELTKIIDQLGGKRP